MIGERFKGQIGIDRPGPVADEEAEMMGLARLAGFDDQAALRAGSLADQMMMHGRRRQQAGDRGVLGIHAAIGEDHDRRALADGLGRGIAQFLDGFFQARFAVGDVEEHRKRDGAQIAVRPLRASFSRSVLERIGCFSLIRWQFFGTSLSRFPSRPRYV